jgi:hypothetical protein
VIEPNRRGGVAVEQFMATGAAPHPLKISAIRYE